MANKKHFKRERPWHVIPDVLDTLGAITPVLEPAAPGWGSPWDYISGAAEGTQSVSDAIDATTMSYTNIGNLVPAAELIVVGEIARYIGKITRLGRIGTKKFRLL